ncbi:hypothetical protein QFZ71_000076 [Streptomyces sp. V2I9]|nr:hypothetical protein [Streptomyces sp. V2I9]
MRLLRTGDAEAGLRRGRAAGWQDDGVSGLPCEPWLRGLAFHPAAPSEVLMRLLERSGHGGGPSMCEGRDLPEAVIDAALRHPDQHIRRALARNRFVAPVRLAPLATDPSGVVRGRLAGGPRGFPRWVRPLPDDILVALLTARDGGEDGRVTAAETAAELVSSRQIPPSFHPSLADHRHPGLRVHATWSWQPLTPEQRTALLDDPDPEVRRAVRGRHQPEPDAADLGGAPRRPRHGRGRRRQPRPPGSPYARPARPLPARHRHAVSRAAPPRRARS